MSACGRLSAFSAAPHGQSIDGFGPSCTDCIVNYRCAALEEQALLKIEDRVASAFRTHSPKSGAPLERAKPVGDPRDHSEKQYEHEPESPVRLSRSPVLQ